VRLHLPVSPLPALRSLAAKYFDPAGLLPHAQYRQFAQVLEAFRSADDRAVVYTDALEYVEWENELADGLDLERKLLAKIKRGQDPTAGVLKTALLPYQMHGALFAACRGRVVSPTTWVWERPSRRWPQRSYCAAAKESRESSLLRPPPSNTSGNGNREIHNASGAGDRWPVARPPGALCCACVLHSHQL
jgi:hypothetical protein